MHDSFGDLIKRTRKQKSLSLVDLSDKNLSKSAISRIEQGQPVEEDKISLILRKLDIKEEDIPELVSKMNQDDEISQFISRGLEAQVRHDVLTFAEFNEKLQQVSLPASADYLRAKRYFIKGNYKKAKKHFEDVINAEANDCCPKMNLKSSTFVNLSVIAYKDSDYQDSLRYLDLGLEHFNDQGDRHHIQYSIHYNRALIFYQLGDIKAAEKALEPAWKNRLFIEDVRTKIQVYQLKASIKRHYKKYDEAVYILQKALDIAVINDIADGAYYVLVDLGELAIQMELTEYAERCFQSAIRLKKVLVKAHTTLAHLELSKFLISQNRFKEAKEQIQEAIKSTKKTKDKRKRIQAFMILGGIYEEEGNKFDACSHYKKALKIAEDHLFDRYIPEILEGLSRCK
jgi:tetratricopeptide (TPR) repeat protein